MVLGIDHIHVKNVRINGPAFQMFPKNQAKINFGFFRVLRRHSSFDENELEASYINHPTRWKIP